MSAFSVGICERSCGADIQHSQKQDEGKYIDSELSALADSALKSTNANNADATVLEYEDSYDGQIDDQQDYVEDESGYWDESESDIEAYQTNFASARPAGLRDHSNLRPPLAHEQEAEDDDDSDYKPGNGDSSSTLYEEDETEDDGSTLYEDDGTDEDEDESDESSWAPSDLSDDDSGSESSDDSSSDELVV